MGLILGLYAPALIAEVYLMQKYRASWAERYATSTSANNRDKGDNHVGL